MFCTFYLIKAVKVLVEVLGKTLFPLSYELAWRPRADQKKFSFPHSEACFLFCARIIAIAHSQCEYAMTEY